MLEGANEYSILTFVAIGTALFFDFVNGFHDSANAIATVVGTRVLKPLHAVTIAAFANFVGPFLFGTAIATTVGNGIIKPEFSTVDIILAGLIGAIIWDLITWYFGLPSSSSHALIGGLVGSALIVGGWDAIIVPGVEKVLIFMILSPVVGFVIAFVLAMIIIYFLKGSKPLFINQVFGKLQIVSSTFFSLTHGANDGQKTMGVITALLIAGGFMSSAEFIAPTWVIISAAAAISAGTFLGGWRFALPSSNLTKVFALKLGEV
jgi:inorganic phosphate transporter, PiT family